MSWKRMITFLFALMLAAGFMGSVSLSYSAPDETGAPPQIAAGHEASVTITLADMGLEFGAIDEWEASLYAGAESGAETSGRFTDWKEAEDGVVVFNLPDEIREGSEAPWGVPYDAYARFRHVGDDPYPTFDMVSDPFTLNYSDYVVHIDIDGINEYADNDLLAGHEEADITVMLQDWGGDFGAPGEWEASLYAGADPGAETSGRFTDWVAVQDGAVLFSLPDDVREGSVAPWDDDAYIRVRPVDRDDDYPQFDLVGRPFVLTDGQDVTSYLRLSRAAVETDATVVVSFADLGLDFGAIDNWQASLYAGAVAGEETGGRFTDWVDVDNGYVAFALPQDIREGHDAPWAVPYDTYVRVRSGGGEYPSFDLVGAPFTLLDTHFVAPFAVEGVNEYIEDENGPLVNDESADITVYFEVMDGLFGMPDTWEASLYAGAVAGEETSDRFTDWVEVDNGAVVFSLPDDIRPGDEAPWGEEAYVRIRHVGAEAYPTFDLVGLPFDLNDGIDVITTLYLHRPALQADATVTVTLADMGLEFGAIDEWEASLYAGAESGAETSGRFTAWKSVEDGQVIFLLPGEVRDGSEAPWCQADDAYVRIRARDTYPTFDMVSDPFTLCESDYVVHFDFDGVNEYMTNDAYPLAEHEAADIAVMLQDWGGDFGAPGEWEASLYAGTDPGDETSGRFTDWVAVQDGAVLFSLPDDVREGSVAPWDDYAYIRVRPVDRDDDYPQFDLVGRPFVLTDGQDVLSQIILSRLATETVASVTVNLFDMGLEFGAIENWQASLYAGADIGAETSGRFTDWFDIDNGAVTFVLPEDIRDGSSAPWAVPYDTYLRVRSGSGEYPSFDLVSDPFTLADDDYTVHIVIDSVNEYMENEPMILAGHETAQVTVHLQDWGGDFGAPGLWEASLYAGANPGEETSGRFTDWVEVVDGAVVFDLPDDVRDGSEAPWDEYAYVRLRHVGEDVYPTFDLVGRPFTLSDGANVHTTITWQRGLVTFVYLPVIMND